MNPTRAQSADARSCRDLRCEPDFQSSRAPKLRGHVNASKSTMNRNIVALVTSITTAAGSLDTVLRVSSHPQTLFNLYRGSSGEARTKKKTCVLLPDPSL